MNILFKELTSGATVYALVKDDEMKYLEGSIVSVGQQRSELPKMPAGQIPNPMQMPAIKNVVDVTYQLEGKNYTEAVDVSASAFVASGSATLVSTDKDAVVRELHATLKNSENYIADAEKQIPKQKKRVQQCKELIAQLDTAFMEKQQTEQRFTKIEEAQKEQGNKLDKILELLSKK